ncbi:MAG: hypothetical protein ACNA7I_08355, partial [Candidatus Methanoperedens sp.]
VYQEQVMQLSKDLAGFTGGQADNLRKAIGKKIAALLTQMRGEFVEGCERNSIGDKLANKIFAEIDKIRKQLNLDDGPSLNELKKEIERLEFKQQTEVLNSGQEREIVESIAHMTEEFKRKKSQLEGSTELKSLLEEAQKLRDEASEYHTRLKEAADAAQQHHDKMIEIFKEADKVRDDSDAAHKEFVKAQEAADEQHRLFIQSQKEIRELNKVIIGLKRKSQATREDNVKELAKKEAEDVYNKFKLGEKLDTEDLMLLQRSGML